MTTNVKMKSCPCCSSHEISFEYTTHDRHFGYIHDNFDVYQCNVCHLVFINPMISQDKLNVMYGGIKNYYAYGSLVPKRKSFFRNLIVGTQSSFPDLSEYKNKNLLDIGCGSGSFLLNCMNNGINAFGVEISSEAAKIGLGQGINIFNGTLIDAKFPNENFEVVRSSHSFEHMLDPKETLVEINRILKKNGILFIVVPNTDSIPYRLFKKYWYHLGVPFHPYNYNVDNLKYLLNETGYKFLNVKYTGGLQGILGSIQIILNRKNNKTSTEGSFTNLVTKVLFEQLARIFNLFSQGDCIEITAIKN